MPGSTDELVSPHLDAVWRTARLLTGNDADAEDLVQDTFVKAWTHRDARRDPTATRAWLLQIAVNAFRDEARRSGTRRRHLRLAGIQRPATTGAAAAPAAPAEADEARDRVSAALATLPTNTRAVLHLTAAEGLAPRTIAEVLGLTPSNVTTILARGRQALRAALATSAEVPVPIREKHG